MSLAPPFTHETAHAKVKKAQDLWNTQNPKVIAQAYTPESIWRNRSSFLVGTAAIEDFLTKKWEKEKELPLAQGALRLYRKQNCRSVLVRVPGCSRRHEMEALLRPRRLDLCRGRKDAQAPDERQQHGH
ncbi:hypothetical protein ACJQWK_11200 [Exserohilum turcicum]